MKQITRREAIEALKGMFETNKREECNIEGNISCLSEHDDDTATFMLDKNKYERGYVIGVLSDYFKDVTIIDGQCRIDNITFVFTNVYIEKRPDNKEE